MNHPRLAFTDFIYQDVTLHITSSHYTSVCVDYKLQLRNLFPWITQHSMKTQESNFPWACIPGIIAHLLKNQFLLFSAHLKIISIFMLAVRELRAKYVAYMSPVYRASEWAFGSIVIPHVPPFPSLSPLTSSPSHSFKFMLCIFVSHLNFFLNQGGM